MKAELDTVAVTKPCAEASHEERSSGLASINAVARALGFTDTELLFAADVLNRYVWRYSANPGGKKTSDARGNKAA
jgi:hypothetical protein